MHRLTTVGLLAALLLGVAACHGEPPPSIIVGQGRVTVINRTETAWRDVDVWLNDHYRVQAKGLEVGQRLDIPIGTFIAGFGQRFDSKKQVPYGIAVDAKGADGSTIRVNWGKGRWR